jgi:hypothetical protein
MREQISRLMDGDLEGAEADAAFRNLKDGDGLDHWVCYPRHRGCPAPMRCSDPRLCRAASPRASTVEPTVLAPKAAHHGSRLPLTWAVAANGRGGIRRRLGRRQHARPAAHCDREGARGERRARCPIEAAARVAGLLDRASGVLAHHADPGRRGRTCGRFQRGAWMAARSIALSSGSC